MLCVLSFGKEPTFYTLIARAMKKPIFASDITDTDTLLKVLQSLPRKPQCVRNKN